MMCFRICIISVVLFCNQLVHCQNLIHENEYFDVFETDFKEWRLAFRGTPNISLPVLQAYTNKQTGDVEPECRQVSPAVTCTHHYRNNDVMDNWADIDQVAFVVYKGDKRVAHIIFDGKGSDYLNWFSDSRVVNSTWTDITGIGKNFFSVQGDRITVERTFFINKNYGGCDVDVGWFVVVDTHGVCPWEVVSGFPAFMYAKNNARTNWTTGDVGFADVIAVFVKYNKGPGVGK